MAKIRHDLEGVVFAYGSGDATVVLRAGDDVPEGVLVGDHLVAASRQAKNEPANANARPRGNAGRDAWAKYASSAGVEFDEDATRDEIKAAVEAAEG